MATTTKKNTDNKVAKAPGKAKTGPVLVEAMAGEVVEMPSSEPKGPAPDMLKMKDLLALVIEANGGKRNGVRTIVDATLAAIGASLQKGEVLNLPPLGRARVTRQQEEDGGVTLMVRLKRSTEDSAGKSSAKETLAEENDQG